MKTEHNYQIKLLLCYPTMQETKETALDQQNIFCNILTWWISQWLSLNLQYFMNKCLK